MDLADNHIAPAEDLDYILHLLDDLVPPNVRCRERPSLGVKKSACSVLVCESQRDMCLGVVVVVVVVDVVVFRKICTEIIALS